MKETWEAVIGLEVHVQLNTKSKIFSSAPNRFGDEPNTNISYVCTGQPGALPILNQEVVKKAVLFGLSINAEIAPYSEFARKSYFYPDSPRNFQITQFDHPIIKGGTLITEIDEEKISFPIHHAHLEDDAGMLKHFSSFAGVDYNRAGVPLIEVVSEPSMRSAKQAVAYVKALKAIMEYIGASDCNMDEGSLRIDANISVRPKGEKTLRNKTEIKNMNSFTFLELAIDGEISRQIALYENNPDEDISLLITPGTYRWDAQTKQSILMRKKESADDYRYFPEPDLPPIFLKNSYIEKMKKELPELPMERKERYIQEYGLSPYNAHLLTEEKRLADFFEKALNATQNYRSLCNWMMVEFLGRAKAVNHSLFSLDLKPEYIGQLVDLIDTKVITGKIAKQVADDMIRHPDLAPQEIIEKNPLYKPLDDTGVIPIIEQVLADNEQSIIDYLSGRTKAFSYLIGQVMKLSQGKANPETVNKLLLQKLEQRKNEH